MNVRATNSNDKTDGDERELFDNVGIRSTTQAQQQQ